VILADFKGQCMGTRGNLHQDQSTSRSKPLDLISRSSAAVLQLSLKNINWVFCLSISICKKLHCPVEVQNRMDDVQRCCSFYPESHYRIV